MYEIEIAGHWKQDKDARFLEDLIDASGEGTMRPESSTRAQGICCDKEGITVLSHSKDVSGETQWACNKSLSRAPEHEKFAVNREDHRIKSLPRRF